MTTPSLALREIIRFHLVIGLFAAILGWAGLGAFIALLPAGTLSEAAPVTVAPGTDDLLHILGNNAGFFSLVCVLPIVNFLIFVPQFVFVGSHAHAIADLPAGAQFDLLYRHTALEIVALVLAIAVSYQLLFAVRAYLDAPGADRGVLLHRLRPALLTYPVILALTLVGALLEGNAVVHV